MPQDIAGAIAEMANLPLPGDADPSDAPQNDTQAAETGADPPAKELDATGTPPATPEPDAAALAREQAKERLEAIREKRRAQREKYNVESAKSELGTYEQRLKRQYEELAARQRQIDDLDSKWKAALKDPLKFRDLGHDPLDLYKKITEAAATADTPEGHAARLKDEFESRLADKDRAIQAMKEQFEALQKAIEEDRLTRHQEREHRIAQERTQRYFDILKLDKYQDLTDFYGEEELVAMANAWHDPARGAIDPQAAADAVLSWFESKDQRRAARRKEREAAKQSAGATGAPSESPAESRPTTIGNATATASASAPPPRRKTREELRREAEAELGVFLAPKKR